MRTGSPRGGQVIHRNKSAPQSPGRRRTGRLCLLIGLCLLVLAVTPVAAQAEPKRWYQNAAKATEGEEIPIVMFGNEEDLTQLGAEGTECRNVGGGTIENPVGGGAGVGRTNSLVFYECKGEQCEKDVLERLGVSGRVTVTFANNPAATNEPAFPGWNDVLEESTVAGVTSVREKIGEPFVTYKTPSPPGMLRETENCEVSSTKQVLASFIYEGELKPEIGVAKAGNLNGTSAAAPSQFRFGASTGALRSQQAPEAQWQGGEKYLGYNHQELITVQGSTLTLKLIPEGSVIGGEWVFPVAERKALTIENPGPGPAELLMQRMETTEGLAAFTPVFLGPPEPPNCSMFSNPPVVSLPAGGKCTVAVEYNGANPAKARYLLTYKEPATKTVELKVRD